MTFHVVKQFGTLFVERMVQERDIGARRELCVRFWIPETRGFALSAANPIEDRKSASEERWGSIFQELAE